MFQLGLKKCEHTAIGLPGSVTGISGGEKKRLAFGTVVWISGFVKHLRDLINRNKLLIDIMQ